jgi:hypothetical protein
MRNNAQPILSVKEPKNCYVTKTPSFDKTNCIFCFICVSVFYSSYFSINIYKYSNSDGSFPFVAIPGKGRDLELMKRRKASYLENNYTKDITIYRTFKSNIGNSG